jgi:alginate O-acetyltransferase complex protein AlgI
MIRRFLFVLMAAGALVATSTLWIVPAFAIVHGRNSRGAFSEWWQRVPVTLFATGYGCVAAVVLLFIPPRYTPFIYFRF